MLDDGGDRDDRHALDTGEGGPLLVAYAEVGRACAHDLVYVGLARYDDIHVEARASSYQPLSWAT